MRSINTDDFTYLVAGHGSTDADRDDSADLFLLYPPNWLVDLCRSTTAEHSHHTFPILARGQGGQTIVLSRYRLFWMESIPLLHRGWDFDRAVLGLNQPGFAIIPLHHRSIAAIIRSRENSGDQCE